MEYQNESGRFRTNTISAQRQSIKGDPEIRRTRLCLLIVLGFFLAIFLAATFVLFNTKTSYELTAEFEHVSILAKCLLSVFWYSFGLFVTYRCSTTGLRVFAWMQVLGITFSLYVFAVCIAHWTVSLKMSNTEDFQYGISSLALFLIGTFSVVYFIIDGFIAYLAFKLVKLIAAKKYPHAQEV